MKKYLVGNCYCAVDNYDNIIDNHINDQLTILQLTV